MQKSSKSAEFNQNRVFNKLVSAIVNLVRAKMAHLVCWGNFLSPLLIFHLFITLPAFLTSCSEKVELLCAFSHRSPLTSFWIPGLIWFMGLVCGFLFFILDLIWFLSFYFESQIWFGFWVLILNLVFWFWFVGFESLFLFSVVELRDK